jgi:hypothetical protein
MDTLTKFITPGVILLLTLASGLWLSNSGKPLNTVIFTIHKLIALGTVVMAGIQLSGTLKNSESQSGPIALLVLAGLCVMALFATGALMSIGKLSYAVLLGIHRSATIVAAISATLAVYLLSGRSL